MSGGGGGAGKVDGLGFAEQQAIKQAYKQVKGKSSTTLQDTLNKAQEILEKAQSKAVDKGEYGKELGKSFMEKAKDVVKGVKARGRPKASKADLPMSAAARKKATVGTPVGWMSAMMDRVKENHPNRTHAILADQTEVKDGLLKHILPQGYSESKDFRQDLNMAGHYWFYDPHRVVLLQKAKDAKDAKEEDIRKSYRAFGATAAQVLQAKKTKEVHFFTTPKIEESMQMPFFENSFRLSNYEFSKKTVVDDPEKDKEIITESENKDSNKTIPIEVDEDKDERMKRVSKKIDAYSISAS